MKLFYIAGPFRGPTPWAGENNIREVETLGLLVANAGGVPIIPHAMYRFFDKALPDQFWIEATADLLMRCDALVLHPSWQKSAGSRAELELAQKHRFPVLDFAKFVPVLARVDSSFSALVKPFVDAVNEGFQAERGETWNPR